MEPDVLRISKWAGVMVWLPWKADNYLRIGSGNVFV